MMSSSLLIQNGLFYGTLLSLLLSTIVMGTLYINPEIGWRTYPPDVKVAFGPMSLKARRQRRLSGLIFFGDRKSVV